jgi:hypothetical protein
MALIQVVLKWKTSATNQSHIYQSINLKLGKVYNVTRFTNPAKSGEDRINGALPRGGELYESRVFLFLITRHVYSLYT